MNTTTWLFAALAGAGVLLAWIGATTRAYVRLVPVDQRGLLARLNTRLQAADIPLSAREELIRSLEGFAAQQELPLTAPAGPELEEDVVLAACHLPAQNLFVFAEEPRLLVKRRGEAVELTLTGPFKARRLPCRETDLVIHLTRPAMARLVALVLSLARSGV